MTQPPAIFWHSDPVAPDETVLLAGHGFPGASLELLRLADGDAGLPPAAETCAELSGEWNAVTPLARDANSVALVVPAGWKAGAFACRIVDEQESSGITVFHAPAAGWVQGDAGLEATAGGWLRVLGKCLDFNGPQPDRATRHRE